jgi:hypothetical protein
MCRQTQNYTNKQQQQQQTKLSNGIDGIGIPTPDKKNKRNHTPLKAFG